MKNLIPPPIFPREHGAWALLFLPMISAIITTSDFNVYILIYAVCVFFAFISYLPAQVILKYYTGIRRSGLNVRQAYFWLYIYIGTSFVFFSFLILHRYTLLIPIGIIGILAFVINFVVSKSYGKTIAGDLISVFGLSLSCPGAYYVLRGSIDGQAVSLWLLNFTFFSGSIFYVHMKIASVRHIGIRNSFREKITLGGGTLIYYFLFFVAVGILFWKNYLSLLIFISVIPMIVQAVYGTLNLGSRIRFKRLGFILLAQSIVFCLLTAFSLR